MGVMMVRTSFFYIDLVDVKIFSGFRGPLADFLRNQCQKILFRLLKQVPMRTKSYLKHMVKTSLLHELIDFFHSFTAFCVDPNSLLSPLSKYSIKIIFFSQSQLFVQCMCSICTLIKPYKICHHIINNSPTKAYA